MTETTTEILRYAAFTEKGTGGNPAGVVLDARGLDGAERLRIAAELGYSETAFVERTGAPELKLRFWSPRAEVAFCGHATIATGVAIAEREGPGTLQFETLAGPITVQTRETPDGLTATLTSVPTRTRPAEPDERARLLEALRLAEDDLDPRYPLHVAFGGNEHPIVALRERRRLGALDYDYAALDQLMAERRWTTVQVLWAERPDLFHARDPFPPGGVVEDPATGAAAAAFGGYLRSLGLVTPPARVTLLQGEDMGRPSRLLVDIREDERIDVSGTAAPIPD